ncbi:MAG: DUF1887 family protein [Clostridia bacterium]|nr:DUF1887 family protein [Clostridia bacterium]
MTLIELYDRTPVENIVAALALKPEKIIYVGSDSRKIRRSVPYYKKILEGRGIRPVMEVNTVAKNDLESIVAELFDLIESAEDDQLVVDISGGDESVLVALGMILGCCRADGKNLYAFRINVVSRRAVLYSIQKGENGRKKIERQQLDFSDGSQVYLTVEENITLHGGRILSKGINFPIGDAAAEDVRAMWEICRRDCSAWNAKIGVLSGAVSAYSDTGKKFMLPENAFGTGRNDVDRKLWNAFAERGLVIIDRKLSRDGLIIFSYKNKIVDECLNKSGSALEYFIYLMGLEKREKAGYVFDDAQLSVVIDWDDEPNGTSNEIDCIFMRGLVPVFVSCKNGDVKTDELYKLDAVSDKFGSGYAKKMLVSTVYFDPASRSYDGDRAVQTLRDRASDMYIRLLSLAHTMTEAEIGEDLAKAVR